MKRALASILFLLLTISACHDGASTPAELQYGKDTCAQCGSTIKDPNFAAFYAVADGHRKLFDDPGCLFRELRGETGSAGTPVFHEHGGERWLSGSEVYFAKTPGVESPQGYDWAAYASFSDAQTAVTSAGSGELLSFAQAKEKVGVDAPQ